jgi:hypothetical protein
LLGKVELRLIVSGILRGGMSGRPRLGACWWKVLDWFGDDFGTLASLLIVVSLMFDRIGLGLPLLRSIWKMLGSSIILWQDIDLSSLLNLRRLLLRLSERVIMFVRECRRLLGGLLVWLLRVSSLLREWIGVLRCLLICSSLIIH